jgi:hypothetical protein
MRSSLLSLAALAAVLASPLGAQAQGQGGAPVAPYAGGKQMTTEEALKQAPKVDPSLVPLDKKFSAAAADLKKNPKDTKVKKAYVDAAYNYGHAAMMHGQQSPKVMYRASLALYRKALAVDPKHKPSLDDKNTIESIYKSMGMPIPK